MRAALATRHTVRSRQAGRQAEALQVGGKVAGGSWFTHRKAAKPGVWCLARGDRFFSSGDCGDGWWWWGRWSVCNVQCDFGDLGKQEVWRVACGWGG